MNAIDLRGKLKTVKTLKEFLLLMVKARNLLKSAIKIRQNYCSISTRLSYSKKLIKKYRGK